MARPRSAFTVIEFVMVIAVIGILTVIAITVFRPYYPIKLEGAAYKLASDIKYAQQLAISKQSRHGIYFDSGAEQYFVYDTNFSNKVPDPLTKNDLVVDYSTGTFEGIEIISTNLTGDCIEFDALGRPRDSSDLLASEGLINLGYQASYNETVKVQPDTGRVSVQ